MPITTAFQSMLHRCVARHKKNVISPSFNLCNRCHKLLSNTNTLPVRRYNKSVYPLHRRTVVSWKINHSTETNLQSIFSVKTIAFCGIVQLSCQIMISAKISPFFTPTESDSEMSLCGLERFGSTILPLSVSKHQSG